MPDPTTTTTTTVSTGDPIADMQAKMLADQAAANAQAKLLLKQNYYKYTLGYGLGAIGNVAGILIAVKRKSGFWGGVGWFFLMGAAGAGSGYLIGSMLDGKPDA